MDRHDLRRSIRFLYWEFLKHLPAKAAVYIIYGQGYHKLLNLKQPRYFGEKIQWLKLYGHLEDLSPYVDKYEVRSYVERTIGPGHLNTLYGLYNSFDEIDFDALPDEFVIKNTNGTQMICTCADKSALDQGKMRRTVNGWMKSAFWRVKKEMQYKNIPNRILIEKRLTDFEEDLIDYKYYCFEGVPTYLAIIYGRRSEPHPHTVIVDMEGNRIDPSGIVREDIWKDPRAKKGNDEMCALAAKLAAPFHYVRVDFYYVQEQVIFGELTFTDGGGGHPFYPETLDLEMGARIPMESLLKNT